MQLGDELQFNHFILIKIPELSGTQRYNGFYNRQEESKDNFIKLMIFFALLEKSEYLCANITHR